MFAFRFSLSAPVSLHKEDQIAAEEKEADHSEDQQRNIDKWTFKNLANTSYCCNTDILTGAADQQLQPRDAVLPMSKRKVRPRTPGAGDGHFRP